MEKFDYELVVIGGGPAGEKGAAQAAYFGHRTALIEKEQHLGGACINTGTLASKTLRESAIFLSGFRDRQLSEGMDVSVKKNITLANLMHRTKLVQQRERQRAERNLQRHQIERISGAASIVDPHTVRVAAPDGSQRDLGARFILIATGSTPARPADVPFNPDSVFDSDSVLEMKRVPRSMLVLGGGVIACEYACLFAALGLDVKLVARDQRVLAFIDTEIGEALTSRMKQVGVEMILGDWLDGVAVDGSRVTTTLKSGRQIAGESLLYAAGRSGNTKNLGLEKLNIPTGKYGHIEKVHPSTYQTVVPNIYAAGDVIGPPALAGTSMEQARLAMCHAFDLKYKTRLSPILPAGIYTIPEISCVGLSEQQCQAQKIPYVVGRALFGEHARGQIIGDTDGMIKLIFDATNSRLLGAHIIGEMASELVHVAAACLFFEGGIDYFIQGVFNYPTLGDAFKYAAYDALARFNTIHDGVRRIAGDLASPGQ